MINECTIAHTMIGNKVVLAKNRDRTYTAQVRVVRELINDIEIILYIYNKMPTKSRAEVENLIMCYQREWNSFLHSAKRKGFSI